MSSTTTRFEKLLEAVPDALVGMDQKGVIRFVNRQTELLFGFDRDQLIGQPIQTLVPEPLWQIYAEHQKSYVADPRTRSGGLEVELSGRHGDGSDFPINISLSHIDTGDVLLVITATADVTRHKVAVKDAELIAAIVEASDDAIIGSTLGGILTSWNPAAQRMYGFSSKEIIGRFGGFLYPDDRDGELTAILARIKDGEAVEHAETTLARKDGSVFPVSITFSPIHDEDGAVVGACAVHRDVTELRKAYEAAQRMAAIVEHSHDAIIGTTLEGIITSWNPAAERMYGYSGKEIIGKPGDLLAPEDRASEILQILATIKAGHDVENFQTSHVRRNGSVFPVSFTASAIYDADGAIVGASAVHRDVTEQRKAFEAAQRMAAIVESSDDAIVSSTLERVITSWNPAAERMFGYSSQEMIGTSAKALTPKDRVGEIGAILTTLGEGRPVERLDTVRVRKDGTSIPVSLTVSPIRDGDGAVVGTSLIARDMTQLQHAAQYARSLIEAALDPLVTISPEGKITDVNESTIKATGVPRQALVGTDFSGYFTDPRKADQGYQEAFARGAVTNYPLTLRHRGIGTLTDVVYNASLYRDTTGKVIGVLAAARDVTELKQAARYARSLIEAALDPLVTISPEGKITDVNEATVNVTGIPRDRLIGTDFSGYFTDPDKAHLGYQRAFAKGVVTDYPLTLRHRDGTLTDVMYNASLYRDANGNVLGVLATARDMTQQKETFEAAQRMAAIVEHSDDAIIGSTLDGLVTSWNPAAERMYGYSSERIVRRSIDLLSPRDRTGEIKAVLAQIAAGQPVDNFETICSRKDRTTFPVKLTIAAVRDADGAVVGASAIARDVTEQREALAAAQQMAAIVEFSGEAIIGCTLEGIITSWNPAAERAFGHPGREIIGRSGSILSPADRSGEIISILARVRDGEAIEDFETVCVRKDATTVPISLTIAPIRDAGSTIIGASAIARDITEHKATETLARLAAAIEFSGEALISNTLEGVITSWNPAAERLYGYSSEEIIGQSGQLLMPVDRAGEVSEIMARIRAGEQVVNFETIRARKDGTVFPISLTITPIRGADGTIIGASSTPRDITKQKEAFEATQHMAAIVENSADAIISQTLEGLITSWNPTAERLYGYSRTEVIGKPVDLLSPEGRTGEITPILARIKAGQPVEQHETTCVRKDGTAIRVCLTVSPIRGANGAIIGASVIHRNLTEHG